MTSRRLLQRVAILLWAVLNLALPGAASLLDGLHGASAGTSYRHFEDTRSSSCASVHADDCTLCRYLTQQAGDGFTPEQPQVIEAFGEAPGIVAPRVVAIGTRTRESSRAPPALQTAL